MIAADSSSLIAFFNGDKGADVEAVRQAFTSRKLCLPPIVITEVLCDPEADGYMEERLLKQHILPTHEGYWQRAAKMRRRLLAKGLKARLADTLISQSCIDHNVPLITRDGDFRHFAKHCGLRLVAS